MKLKFIEPYIEKMKMWKPFSILVLKSIIVRKTLKILYFVFESRMTAVDAT